VSREEAEEYAKECGLLFFETSAKTGEGVVEVFTEIGTLPLYSLYNTVSDERLTLPGRFVQRKRFRSTRSWPSRADREDRARAVRPVLAARRAARLPVVST
jgi:hypothetical protein